MPRIERGSLVIDVSRMLSARTDTRARLLVNAAKVGAVLVTRPAIVSTYTSMGALKISIGPGSIVLPPGTSDIVSRLGLKALEVSAPEWVDGCRMTLREPPERLYAEHNLGGEITGRLVPGSLSDVVSLFLSGASARARGARRGVPPVATVKMDAVAWYSGGELITTLVESEARDRLDYILLALSFCEGEG